MLEADEKGNVKSVPRKTFDEKARETLFKRLGGGNWNTVDVTVTLTASQLSWIIHLASEGFEARRQKAIDNGDRDIMERMNVNTLAEDMRALVDQLGTVPIKQRKKKR